MKVICRQKVVVTSKPRFHSLLQAQIYVRNWKKGCFDLQELCPGVFCVLKNNLVLTKALDFHTAVAMAEWKEFPNGGQA
jgi:hypothetical protein